MILVIDNYDSFVHNLARYVRELGEHAIVERTDALSVEDVEAMSPSHIIISPGPCSPNEAGISVEVIRRMGPSTPILGVCLGHQCVGAAYGGDIIRAVLTAHEQTAVPFRTFNVATGDYITVSEIAELAVECVGLPRARVKFDYTGGDRGWKGDVPIVRLDTARPHRRTPGERR